MKVTQIEEFTKSRVRITVDEEITFVLYKSEQHKFHIRPDEEIEETNLRIILEELLPKRARLRAMNLLKNREYTVKQLHDKLKQGGYPESVIGDALDYVGSCRYTDDLRYAVNFIRNHQGDRSRRRIEQDLTGRGIERNLLEKAWAEWEGEGGSQNEQAMIQALLAKKGFDSQTAAPRDRQKMFAFLMRKGFSGEQVRRAVQPDEYYE